MNPVRSPAYRQAGAGMAYKHDGLPKSRMSKIKKYLQAI